MDSYLTRTEFVNDYKALYFDHSGQQEWVYCLFAYRVEGYHCGICWGGDGLALATYDMAWELAEHADTTIHEIGHWIGINSYDAQWGNSCVNANCFYTLSKVTRYTMCQHHWDEIEDLARQIVSLECIGGKSASGTALLKPIDWCKSATHYLREQLGLDQNIDPANCQFKGCARPEKRALCNRVTTQAWNKNEMVALMRLVYQVRCSLVDGEKRLGRKNFQTDRDRELVRLADEIMDHFLIWIINDTP